MKSRSGNLAALGLRGFPSSPKRATLDDLLRFIAAERKLRPQQILGRRGKDPLILARHLLFWSSMKVLNVSNRRTARMLGEFARATISHGCQSFQNRLDVERVDGPLHQLVARITERFGESHTNASTPQCSSGGRSQSRPFPARAAKMMESAGHIETTGPVAAGRLT